MALRGGPNTIGYRSSWIGVSTSTNRKRVNKLRQIHSLALRASISFIVEVGRQQGAKRRCFGLLARERAGEVALASALVLEINFPINNETR